MNALRVFSMSIEYLKDHAIQTLGHRATGVTEKDVHWVLTVPAIWNDNAKQFMREAAEKVKLKLFFLLIQFVFVHVGGLEGCILFLLITKTCLYNFDPLKPHFYILKLGFTGVYIIFLISAQKHRLWVLIRTALQRQF